MISSSSYPYPPHYIDIGISIMSGIRLQPGAPRHFGGSYRTIIKQAYEMLVSNRTRLADCPIGTLVTLDRVYELVEGNLRTSAAPTFTKSASDSRVTRTNNGRYGLPR